MSKDNLSVFYRKIITICLLGILSSYKIFMEYPLDIKQNTFWKKNNLNYSKGLSLRTIKITRFVLKELSNAFGSLFLSKHQWKLTGLKLKPCFVKKIIKKGFKGLFKGQRVISFQYIFFFVVLFHKLSGFA